jgi:hypothetical protein
MQADELFRFAVDVDDGFFHEFITADAWTCKNFVITSRSVRLRDAEVLKRTPEYGGSANEENADDTMCSRCLLDTVRNLRHVSCFFVETLP